MVKMSLAAAIAINNENENMFKRETGFRCNIQCGDLGISIPHSSKETNISIIENLRNKIADEIELNKKCFLLESLAMHGIVIADLSKVTVVVERDANDFSNTTEHYYYEDNKIGKLKSFW